MSIRVIAFDIGGVLAGDMHGPLLKKLAKRYHPSMKNAIEHAGDEPWKKLRVGKISEDCFWNSVISAGKLHQSVPDLKHMLRKSMRVFWGPMAVVERLEEYQQYTLAILSNHAESWFEELWKRFRFHDLFNRQLVVVSYRINCAKPSPAAFCELMMPLIGTVEDIRRSECLFIDDKARNTNAARKLGFAALQFDGSKPNSGHQLEMSLRGFGIHV